MIRYTSFLCLIILLGGALGVFKVKFYVQNLRKDILEMENQLSKEKNAIRVLKAEWTYLNQPERLRKLANKYTKLLPLKVDKIHKTEKELPIYLSEDSAGREMYLASVEFAKNTKKPQYNTAVMRVRGAKNSYANKVTKVKY